jgi:hypothetical protein
MEADEQPSSPVYLLDEVDDKLAVLLAEVARFGEVEGDTASPRRDIRARLERLLVLRHEARPAETATAAGAGEQAGGAEVETLQPSAFSLQPLREELAWGAAVSLVFVHALGRVADETDPAGQSRAWLDEWLLGKSIERALRDAGADEGQAARAVSAVKIAVSEQGWYSAAPVDPRRALTDLLADDEVRRYIGVNRHQGILWFNKERFEELLWWLLLVATLVTEERGAAGPREVLGRLAQAAEASGYQLEKLLALAAGPQPATPEHRT